MTDTPAAPVEVKDANYHRQQIKRLEDALNMYVGMPAQAMGTLMQIANHPRALKTIEDRK